MTYSQYSPNLKLLLQILLTGGGCSCEYLSAEENHFKYYFGVGSSDGKGEMEGDMAKKTSKKQIEQYEHSDKERANNPHVSLMTPSSDPDTGEKKTYEYDPHLDPQLQWAGKAEHTSFDVPTVSLKFKSRN